MTEIPAPRDEPVPDDHEPAGEVLRPGTVLNFYGTRYPTPEQQREMMRRLGGNP